MNIPSLKRPARLWLMTAAIVLTLAGVFVARTAFAKIATNTIDSIGVVADHGRRLVITGPIEVTEFALQPL